ncbi:MAG: hypothetical protein BWY59_00106 [Verrucomicrobia bacterium ADurb.Bin345]|nr:MAG: hypothetical protein BWY59_00106 [Verrucomicrobia bacterium ADurb.Bin345]
MAAMDSGVLSAQALRSSVRKLPPKPQRTGANEVMTFAGSFFEAAIP